MDPCRLTKKFLEQGKNPKTREEKAKWKGKGEGWERKEIKHKKQSGMRLDKGIR